jgi:hypothetical protein
VRKYHIEGVPMELLDDLQSKSVLARQVEANVQHVKMAPSGQYQDIESSLWLIQGLRSALADLHGYEA